MSPRTRAEMAAIIHAIPLFSHLGRTELRAVAKLCYEETYRPEQVILKQLEEAQHLVAIVQGTARVTRDGRTIATVGPGDVIGEIALIDGLKRSAGVVAETEVEGVVLHRKAFRDLLESSPSIALKLLLAQTARLREADKKLAALG